MGCLIVRLETYVTYPAWNWGTKKNKPKKGGNLPSGKGKVKWVFWGMEY